MNGREKLAKMNNRKKGNEKDKEISNEKNNKLEEKGYNKSGR